MSGVNLILRFESQPAKFLSDEQPFSSGNYKKDTLIKDDGLEVSQIYALQFVFPNGVMVVK